MTEFRRRMAALTASAAIALGGVVALAPQASADMYCSYISDSARPYVSPNQNNDAVKQAQCLILFESGFGMNHAVQVDGQYGQETYAGVIWVQHCNGLSEDGIVGPKTWEKLYNPNSECQRFDN
ncbi:peptidoglycan-binding protein [Kitasatospora sp. NPDC059827]|uniref:peptidoglycan-binding domain-containing protein n=1 Tax=Kitasatospora sp. NPDC059827 TaxID=3346964 RepID=UPI00365DCEC9